MAYLGYPGAFPGGFTTGKKTIGAVQKKVSSVGYPGAFPGGFTIGYKTIGAAQKSDITAPSGSVTINGGDAETTTVTVTLTLSATDAESGMSQMQFSNDGITYSALETYAVSKSWDLTAGAGLKTVYVKFTDVEGNVSSAFSDTITLTGGTGGSISDLPKKLLLLLDNAKKILRRIFHRKRC